MTPADRIRELEMSAAAQSAQLDNSNKRLDLLGQAHQETVHKLDEIGRKVAVLEEKVSKLEGAQNKVADRLWSIIPPILAAAIAAVLTWLLTRNNP